MQTKERKDILAIELGNRKDGEIKEKAAKMAEAICELAKIEYMRGFLKFEFGSKNAFMKNDGLYMKYPSECKDIGWFGKIMLKLGIIKQEDTEVDKTSELYKQIVDLFNGIKTYDGTEREKVLNILARELQLNGFSFIHRSDSIEIQWWGD